MASFFGEIKPLLSRAVDDETDDQKLYNVYIDKTDNYNLKSKAKLIIISVGDLASIFVKSHFLLENSLLISSIKCDSESDYDSAFYIDMRSNKNVKTKTLASIFSSKSDIIICEISNAVPEEICYEATELIFKNFLCSQALILSSQHISAYKKENSVFEKPFLKALYTSQYKTNFSSTVPQLETPNYLSGMAASLLMKYEMSKLSAICVVNFVDVQAIDSLNVEVFDDVLKEGIVKGIPTNNDAKSRVSKSAKAKLSSISNLYT